MINALTAMTGGNMIGFAVLGSVIVFGAGVGTGWHNRGEHEKAEQAKQVKILDDKSLTVDVDTSKIAKELPGKISVRVDGANRINTKALEEAAYRTGVLEGKAEGYKIGFKDAEDIPQTCYNDPAFLPNSLRIGAESRYEAIFGSPNAVKQAPIPSNVPGGSGANADELLAGGYEQR